MATIIGEINSAFKTAIGLSNGLNKRNYMQNTAQVVWPARQNGYALRVLFHWTV
jgi:hypothetical protein